MPLRAQRATTLRWGCVATILIAFSASAIAQPKGHAADKNGGASPTSDDSGGNKKKKDVKAKDFNFNALDLNGRTRTPQLLYFLERANEELERASLEKRSFIPHMIKSVDEEQL
jgi:hypothetical protein